MARLTISMPDAMSDYIDAQIQSGRYDTVSEYLRDLIRHEQERDKQAAYDQLRDLLTRAEQSGVSTASVEDIFERVKTRLQQDGTLPTDR